MIYGLNSQVVVLGQNHDAFEIAIFGLIGLVEVNFYRSYCLPESNVGCGRVQHWRHFKDP